MEYDMSHMIKTKHRTFWHGIWHENRFLNFMFSFVVCNVSYKNKNKWKQLKYNKMTCEEMEGQTDVLNY